MNKEVIYGIIFCIGNINLQGWYPLPSKIIIREDST
jgi:hypothetical protein